MKKGRGREGKQKGERRENNVGEKEKKIKGEKRKTEDGRKEKKKKE